MASIHIIYDPDDKISSHPEMEKALHLSSVRLTIHRELDRAQLEGLCVSLATLLMHRVWDE